MLIDIMILHHSGITFRNNLPHYICVRCSAVGVFDDAEIVHVEGEVNPVRDLEIIREELIKKDEQYVANRIASLEKVVVRGGDKKQKPEYVSL